MQPTLAILNAGGPTWYIDTSDGRRIEALLRRPTEQTKSINFNDCRSIGLFEGHLIGRLWPRQSGSSTNKTASQAGTGPVSPFPLTGFAATHDL